MEYILHSKSERGFWSNKDGWSYDIVSATRFYEDYVKMWPMPTVLSKNHDAEWMVVKYED